MIRHLRLDDIDAVANIYNHYISNTVISFEEVPVSADEIKDRVDAVVTKDLPWLVAEEAGEIIGYAYASPWNSRTAYKNSAEITVYLSHLHTSRGVGTSLYRAIFKQLEERLFHTVIGGITLPNPTSVALHEKFGMRKVAHFKEVGFKFEQWLDVGYWQVTLNNSS